MTSLNKKDTYLSTPPNWK